MRPRVKVNLSAASSKAINDLAAEISRSKGITAMTSELLASMQSRNPEIYGYREALVKQAARDLIEASDRQVSAKEEEVEASDSASMVEGPVSIVDEVSAVVTPPQDIALLGQLVEVQSKAAQQQLSILAIQEAEYERARSRDRADHTRDVRNAWLAGLGVLFGLIAAVTGVIAVQSADPKSTIPPAPGVSQSPTARPSSPPPSFTFSPR